MATLSVGAYALIPCIYARHVRDKAAPVCHVGSTFMPMSPLMCRTRRHAQNSSTHSDVCSSHRVSWLVSHSCCTCVHTWLGPCCRFMKPSVRILRGHPPQFPRYACADGQVSPSTYLRSLEGANIVSNMSLLCNIVFYIAREPDIQRAIKCVLLCRAYTPVAIVTGTGK